MVQTTEEIAENNVSENGIAATDTTEHVVSDVGAEAKPKKKRRRKRKAVATDECSSSVQPSLKAPSKIKVFCIFHKEDPIDKRMDGNSAYIPIFGGKTNYHGDSEIVKSMLGDDSGDNISILNPQLNEITAMYWVWKHYADIGSPEYIGFVHYNRFIEWKDEDLSVDTVIANDCDLGGKNVYEQYKDGHVIEDFDKFNKHLKDEFFCGDTKWIRSYDRFLHRKTLYANNIFIMPAKAFINFMENFMSKCIDICTKMISDGEIDLMRKDFLQRKAYGKILERMTGFYIYHMTTVGGYKVKTATVDRV